MTHPVFEHAPRDIVDLIPTSESAQSKVTTDEDQHDIEAVRPLKADDTYLRALARAVKIDPTFDDGDMIIRGRE